MKKFKGLIVALLAVVMAFAFSACGGNEVPKEDVIVVTEVTLDTEGAKTMFTPEEDFTAEGLKVTVKKRNQTQETDLTPEEVALTDSNLTIDSSAFVKGEKGEYAINVTYTLGESSKSASYKVKVAKLAAGLIVEKTSTAYELVAGGTEIALDDISVKIADSHGVSEQALSSDKYSLSFFKGSEEVELTENKLVVTADGVYQIWVKVENYSVSGYNNGQTYTLEGFVLVYVTNEVQSIAFNATADGTQVTQVAGEDVISPTWTFTATYKDGSTAELTYDNVTISGLNTLVATDAGEATVTFTQIDCYGEEHEVSTTVNYTITQKPAESGAVKQILDVSAQAAATYSQTSAIGESGFTAVYKKDIVIEDKTGAGYSHEDFDGELAKRLKLGGTFDTSTGGNGISFKVGAGKTTVTVYYEGNADRVIALYGSDYTKIQESDPLAAKSKVQKFVYDELTFTEETTLNLGSISSGINVWYIEVSTEPATVKQILDVSAQAAATYSQTSAIGESGFTAVYKKDIVIEDKTGAGYSHEDFDGELAKRLKLGGTFDMSTGGNGISFKVGAGKTTVTVYYEGNADRVIALYGSDYTKIQESDPLAAKSKVQKFVYDELTFTEETTLYLGSISSGINVWYIEVSTVG